ncbi:MAG TPA: DNA-processing protein DprA, partial [Thermoanaerobaculia bacterium]|nr:DNA-processing protein DprA [Thermoanaerobaculia bacterium]
TPPRREHFPIRNRIISGLCSAVVVVEASARSGSLITARLAGEQGRDVLAVPGSIFSAGSEGAHGLIQDGAKLLHSIEDLFEELRVERPVGRPKPRRQELPALDPPAERLLSALSRDEARHIDSIASSLGSRPGELAELLLTLEMSGDIKDVGGGRYLRMRE